MSASAKSVQKNSNWIQLEPKFMIQPQTNFCVFFLVCPVFALREMHSNIYHPANYCFHTYEICHSLWLDDCRRKWLLSHKLSINLKIEQPKPNKKNFLLKPNNNQIYDFEIMILICKLAKSVVAHQPC